MVSTFGPEFEAFPKRGISNSESQQLIRDGLRAAGYRCTIYSSSVHTTTPHWKIVPDGSVHGGFELVAPILKGAAGIREMKAVLNIANEFSECRGSSTGMHVHFGVFDKRTFNRSGNLVWSDMSSTQQQTCLRSRQVKRMQVRLNNTMARFKSVIDFTVSASRRIRNGPHRAGCHCRQCMCGGNEHVHITERNGLEFINSRRFAAQGPATGSRFGGRYMKVNFHSLSRHGTVEFRQHQGTMNPVKAEKWIKLCYRLFARSWQQEYLNVRLGQYPKTLAGLMDYAGLGDDTYEWFRGRMETFNAPDHIMNGLGHPDGRLMGRSGGSRRSGTVA